MGPRERMANSSTRPAAPIIPAQAGRVPGAMLRVVAEVARLWPDERRWPNAGEFCYWSGAATGAARIPSVERIPDESPPLRRPTPRRPMRLSLLTLVAALLLTAWFALDFVGVAHLVDREPLISLAGLMLALLGLFLLGGLARLRWLAAPYGLALLVWLALQVETHWGTYLFWPASETKLRWYARVFGDHWRILPDFSGHTTPDGYHTVLAGLLIVNLTLALRDVFARR